MMIIFKISMIIMNAISFIEYIFVLIIIESVHLYTVRLTTIQIMFLFFKLILNSLVVIFATKCACRIILEYLQVKHIHVCVRVSY